MLYFTATPPPPGIDDTLSVCVLASGSKGNCIYIANRKSAILIDAGLSGIEIERRMAARGLSPETLSAIVVSHEHMDHIQGVGVLSRKYRLPVYLSDQTGRMDLRIGTLIENRPFTCGVPFMIDGLTIRPFSTSHDALDPAGFTISCNGKKLGIATDLGIATSMVRHHLNACQCLILEANFDMHMLEKGPYPWPIKQRIKGRRGHLSNESSRELLMEVLHAGLTNLVLAHLSETNNTPERALSVVGEPVNPKQTAITVAGQHTAGPVISL